MTTLTDGTTTVTIPDDLEWTNQFDFAPVSQTTERTIGGSFIVSESALLFGRPITLEGGEQVWMTRQTMEQVVGLAVPDKALTLTLADGVARNVIFNYQNGAPYSADPLWRQRTYDGDDMVKNVTLRFFTINNEDDS